MSGTFLGTPAFPDAARAALGDSQLRRNLAHATGTIRTKRAGVVGEVDEWEQLRLAGAAIKDRVLRHLPDYLEQLERSLTAAGATVHWARDAAEANSIVVDIARRHGADEVVKVKSMATQEIDLNAALSDAGIHAWETDLAELIVQLGDDLPSHILVPAIHRNRAEIREIFLREMGRAGRAAPADLTDEPAQLAAAARAHLREKFLRAKVAVSGANFAVAETGTLTVVESEGNGRMCLTLPEVLVSVVGIEKVLPTFADLDVMLQLLPRSSTGERMNPYTSTWTGVTPGDGPQEVHVVLLDNGRTDVLADPTGRQALRCIRCSACLNVCPVYERTGGHAYGSVYPGPIGAILTPQLRGVGADPQTDSLPYASSLCGACFEVCPVRIDIPEVLVHLRGEVVDAHKKASSVPSVQDMAMRAASWTLSSAARTERAERVAGLGGRLAARAGRHAPGGRTVLGAVPGPGAAWSESRDVPVPAAESFRAWWERTDGGRSRTTDTDGGRSRTTDTDGDRSRTIDTDGGRS
ncbi:lactate utilization protein B [Pseudonocardia sp. NPDC049635]|uniref:lactate utilization protein B n=1 Tax=Pseudonocardia sp. NPDC049635 TaxID=3155506 RepID=UPI00340FDC12